MSQQQNELQELQNLDPTSTGEMNVEQTNRQAVPDENPEHSEYVPGNDNKEVTSHDEYSSGQQYQTVSDENPEHAQYVPGKDDKEVTSPRNEYSLEQQDIDKSDSSEDSETGNQGYGPEQITGQAGMTTWSNIKGQRSDRRRQKSKPTNEDISSIGQQSVNSRKRDEVSSEAISMSYVEELQNHYEKVCTESSQSLLGMCYFCQIGVCLFFGMCVTHCSMNNKLVIHVCIHADDVGHDGVIVTTQPHDPAAD